MTKIHKSVLRSSIVMLSLFALTVAGSGVAQAQRCKAYERMPNVVRAEGITETVGGIELRCIVPGTGSDPLDTGATVPAMVEITVALNTRITNVISDERDVPATSMIGYVTGRLVTGAAPGMDVFSDVAKLSDDGRTLEFEIASTDLNLLVPGSGFRWLSPVSEPTPPRWEMVKMSPRW